MSDYSKVAWSEGMFLRPQHFQQQERHHSYVQGRLFQASGPHQWGVLDCLIDDNLLGLGQFNLTEFEGIFNDGTHIKMPTQTTLPDPLLIPAGTTDCNIVLALPIDKTTGLNTASKPDCGVITRYLSVYKDVTDTSLENLPVESIAMAKLSAEFKLASQDLTGYVAIPIARVVNVTDTGEIQLDKKFIAPCLSIRSAKHLVDYVNEVTGMVAQRAEAIAARLTKGQGQGQASTVADYMMLQFLNRSEPLLLHHLHQKTLHPEQLFQLFASLSGELATFYAETKRAAKLPSYQHDNLAMVFGSCMSLLTQTLSVVVDHTAVALALKQKQFGIYVAQLADKSVLEKSILVLAVKVNMSAQEITQNLPGQIKIGPVELIRDLVNVQLPGIGVTALPVAPRQIPYHAGSFYFQLDSSSEYWNKLKNSGGIAIHLSGKFPGLAMELWSIKQ
jgi:type VI secretion system protein ImpJ